jgi:hypothetical protein
MSRVLCRSHTLFRSPRLTQHVNKPISSSSYYLLQRRFTVQTSIQTTQDVVKSSLAFGLDQDTFKPGAINVDQLYQQAKRLVEAKRHDIERSIMKIGSMTTQAPSNYIRFPTPKECMKVEKQQSKMENTLEKDVFLMSLITNVMEPKEIVTIQELIDRLILYYKEILDKHRLTAKVTSKVGFFKWLHQPMLEQCVVIDVPDKDNIALMSGKKRKKRIMEVFDHATIQWTGVTVDKIVERFDAKVYGLEVFPSEAALYLPHVSVTAEEAKERKLSSSQLQRLNEGIMHYYEVR